jgi:hypothetical protein
MFISAERALRICAWLTAIPVIAMLAIFLITGIGQDPLQYVDPVDEYLRLLLQNPPVLRAVLGLDNVFIILYASAFVLLAPALVRTGANRIVLSVAIGLLVMVSLLDMVENFHFMVMLANAEEGLAPSAREIGLQVFESLLKFHVSYLGFFLLGFAIPRQTPGGRALAFLSWYVQAPVGILIYIAPQAIAVPLVFVRFSFFLAASLLAGAVIGRGRDAID